jgi:UPF0755 protein
MWQRFLRPERWLRPGGAALLALLAIAGSGWLGLHAWLRAPLPVGEPLVVELPEGGNLTQFLATLHARDVVLHPQLLRHYARLHGDANRVRPGEYRIERGLTPLGLLDKLVSGEVVQYSVTIVEGFTVRQMLARLREEPKLRAGTSGELAEGWAAVLGIDDTRASPEGLFFPDTYNYHLGMRDVDLLQAAYRRMQQILAEEWEGRVEGLPYRDPYDALIMASLIERETGIGDERAEIAGVFVRRLQRGMLLQTDPTVIYGLGDAFDGNLTRAHLRAPGPYNTYLNAGLPPTPIALPGRASIHAALHPAPGEALYFVARGDGSHVFSATLEEHNRAVAQYQRKRRVRGGDGRR